ncbi:hypothetical protein KKA95_02720, partial [Patescibacteria group bacterium]|nr:hypothetical protein [Patescibacteria group bacterium]
FAIIYRFKYIFMQFQGQGQTFVDPGIIYDQQRRASLDRYQKAVERAGFLNERDKRNWGLLAHMLTTEQLVEGEKLIINEDLRRLKMRQKLERIKPSKEKR